MHVCVCIIVFFVFGCVCRIVEEERFFGILVKCQKEARMSFPVDTTSCDVLHNQA